MGYGNQITYTIQSSSLNIGGYSSTHVCPLSNNGSAKVIPNIPGLNYNYVWTNSLALTVSTSSISYNLGPGIYSVQISATNATNCGVGTGTVLVGIKPNNYSIIQQKYCSNVAYLNTYSLVNFQWYTGTVAIPANQGGVAPSYTAMNVNSNYFAVYTYSDGCKDSLGFNIFSSLPGTLSIIQQNTICQNTFSGTATASIIPNGYQWTGIIFFKLILWVKTLPYIMSSY